MQRQFSGGIFLVKVRGMEINRTMVIWIGLHVLIILDIFLITTAMIFDLSEDAALKITVFDFIVCVILLCEWALNFYKSSPKSVFLKQKDNWISLIASIPFDVLLPAVIPGIGLLRYLRLLKLLRIVVLFNRLFDGFERFMKKSNLDKILGGVIFTVLIFTVLLWIYGSSYGLFDDFYFVIVTLATVGYGDVTPHTFNEKVIALLLIIVGVFVFSTITAAISSFLTDRIMEGDDERIEDKLDKIEGNLEEISKENRELKEEIRQLREMLEKD